MRGEECKFNFILTITAMLNPLTEIIEILQQTHKQESETQEERQDIRGENPSQMKNPTLQNMYNVSTKLKWFTIHLQCKLSGVFDTHIWRQTGSIKVPVKPIIHLLL